MTHFCEQSSFCDRTNQDLHLDRSEWKISFASESNSIKRKVKIFRHEQNGPQFAEDIVKHISTFRISLKFVRDGPIFNKSALLKVMAWRLIGAGPLPEPMLTRICGHISLVTKPQWVKYHAIYLNVHVFVSVWIWYNLYSSPTPPSVRPSAVRPLTHSFTHWLTHSLTHSLTRSLARSLNHSHSLTHYSLTRSLTRSLTHSLTCSPTLHNRTVCCEYEAWILSRRLAF